MAIRSPGDALPCSIPQANAEKLRSIGVKAPAPDASRPAKPEDQLPSTRTIPAPRHPAVGQHIDLHV